MKKIKNNYVYAPDHKVNRVTSYFQLTYCLDGVGWVGLEGNGRYSIPGLC